MEYIPNYAHCFVCGDTNEKGLRHRFWIEGDYVTTNLEATPDYIGHGAIHGGVVVALLDEAMGLSATIKKNCLCVTAELTVRYLKPLKAGTIIPFERVWSRIGNCSAKPTAR